MYSDFPINDSYYFPPFECLKDVDNIACYEKKKILILSLRLMEFVIEVKSPSDRIIDLKKKMLQWQKNGVKLGWLVNKEDETTWVYETGKEPYIIRFEDNLDGGDVLNGFVLNIFKLLHP